MAWSLALALALQTASAFPARYAPKVPAPDQVLVKVNGAPITAADVAPFLWDWRGREALNDLIAYRMAEQEAAKAGVTVSDEDIEKDIERRLGLLRSSLQPGQSLEDALAAQGFSRSRFYVRLRAEMLLDRIALASLIPADWVRASAITVVIESASPTDVSRATARAEEAYQKLKSGVSWSDVLAGYGASVERQGLLDWLPVSEFPEPARTELAKLGKGGISRPALTTRGIEVFRLEERGSEATAAELELLRAAHLARNRQALVDRIRKESKLEHTWPSGG